MNKPKIIYDVLSKLEPYARNPTNIRPYECLKIALGVENNKETDILKLKTKLANTVYEVADTFEADNPDFNDRAWITDLVTFLTMPINDSNAFFAQLQKIYPYTKNMIALQIRSWELIKGKSKILNESDLENAKQNTQQLIDSLINNDELHAQAKAFSIKQLKRILEVIDHYQIYGNEGIIEIIEESIGHTFVNKNYQDFMKSEKSESWKEYLSQLSLVVATSDSVISIGTTLKNLIP